MNTRVDEQLLRHAPNSNVTLFFCDSTVCTESFKNCTTEVIHGDDYDWAVRLQCTVCRSVWWLCKECPLRKKIKQPHVLSRHQYTCHGKNERKRPNNVCREVRREVPVAREDIVVQDMVEETNVVESVIFDDANENSSEDYNVTQDDLVETISRPIALVDPVPEFPINYIVDVRDTTAPMSPKKYAESKKYLSIVRSDLIDELTTALSIHPPSNKNITEFYSFDLLSSGKKFLIAKMMSGEHGTVTDILSKISDEEVDCQLHISDFVSTLTRDQQKQFGIVVDSIQKVYHQTDTFIYYLPKTVADIRRMYIDGHQSVIKNLPVPNVTRLKNHSYVSLMDCVSDFLFRQRQKLNTLEDNLKRIHDKNDLSLFSSERVMEIIQEAIERDEANDDVQGELDVIVLFLKLWSDDFDPNSSIKSNRQSVWVKTVTIFAMTQDGSKVTATYPVATAKKGVDHTEVEHLFGKELLTLNSGQMMPFFCRNKNEPVFVHANIFCVLADQPERRTNLRLSAGNSVHHKRFGYLTDYHQCMGVIRSCIECSALIIEEATTYVDSHVIEPKDSKWRSGNKCVKCTSWMYSEYDKLLSYTPEKAYPTSKLNAEGMVVMKPISRSDLLTCLDDVNLAIERNIWTTATCKAYLKANGFHTKAIEEIIECATNYVAFFQAKESSNEEPHQWMTIKKEREEEPRKFELWDLPPSWYEEETTEVFADVPMHLLLLGISKSVYIKVGKWLKIRHQATDFKESSKGILDQLKLYSLDWCKCLLYPNSSTDKFGGWVAENFLGFVRISQWFYSLLYLIRKPAQVTPPKLDTPRNKWTLKDNKYWLDIRGLPTGGKAKELKERVDKYFTMETQPPVLETNLIGVDDIMNMINSLNIMISLVLSKHTKYIHLSYLECAIRHFLICYDRVDSAMKPKTEKPSWMTQYNFLCLLNLPDTMAKFGCLRNIWEGGVEGEGFLRKYKKELKHGLRPQWQIYSIINLLRRGVYDGEIFPTETKWKVELAKECRIYNTYRIMMLVVRSGQPISAISIPSSCTEDDDKLFMVYRTKKRKMKAWNIIIDYKVHETYCHMKYYSIALSSICIDVDEELAKRSTGCLLLPQIRETKGFKKNNDKTKYCIVYSDWRL